MTNREIVEGLAALSHGALEHLLLPSAIETGKLVVLDGQIVGGHLAIASAELRALKELKRHEPAEPS